MFRPSTYVVDADVADFPADLAQVHAAELEQWRLRDELTPTALGVIAVLTVFRGMRTGRDGCGLQLTVGCWQRLLGRSERQVQYAFDELQACGFIFRRRRYVELPEVWTDEGTKHRGPKTHATADVPYVTYLTELGARRIERRGETRQLTVVVGRGLVRVLRASGVVGNLLKDFGRNLRVIAKRVTDAAIRCTPSSLPSHLRSSNRRSARPDGNGAGCAPPLPRAGAPPGGLAGELPGTFPNPTTPPHAAASGPYGGKSAATRWVQQLEELWSRRVVVAGAAWPEAWAVADEVGRKWLTKEFSSFKPVLEARLRAELRLHSAGHGRTR